MKKSIKYLLLSLSVCFLFTSKVQASQMPTVAGKTKWSVKVTSSQRVTPPTYGNGSIYVASQNKLYRLNKETGNVMAESTQLTGSVGYAIIPVTYIEDKHLIVVATIDGTGSYVTGLDEDTMKVKWVSNKIEGQILTKMTYQNGWIYTGSWSGGETGSGIYVKVDANTGEMTTIAARQSGEGGFYWAGAGMQDSFVVFGSEDGVTNAGTGNLYVYKEGEETAQKYQLTNGSGDVRSQIVVYEKNLYFTSKAGFFHKAIMDDNEGMVKDETIKLSGQSTSTPVIVGGKAYVGVSNQTIVEIDISNMQITKTYQVPGYVQGDMLHNQNYLYATYNQSPGGIYCINLSTGKGYDIYSPSKGKQQYCISPIITDGDGTLYYKNDSGYIFAVDSGLEQVAITVKNDTYQSNTIAWDKITGASGYEIYQSTSYGGTYTKIGVTSGCSYRKSGLKSNQTYYYKVRAFVGEMKGSYSGAKGAKTVLLAPSISLSAGSKKMKIKWKKIQGASGYEVYQKTSSKGKYKKIATVKKGSITSYTKKKLKKKRRYYYRVRCYRVQNGRKSYSSYSSSKNKKTK